MSTKLDMPAGLLAMRKHEYCSMTVSDDKTAEFAGAVALF